MTAAPVRRFGSGVVHLAPDERPDDELIVGYRILGSECIGMQKCTTVCGSVLRGVVIVMQDDTKVGCSRCRRTAP